MEVEQEIRIDEKVRKETKEPPKYKVIFLNDNHTPVEWVIEILVKLFKHSNETAEQLTLTIHNEGAGVVGIYSFEIAEQKTIEATDASRERGFPLKIKVEQE